MSKTFHEDNDAGAAYATILHSEALQGLIEREDVDIEELTRAVLVFMGENPHAWEEWTEAVREAVLAYNENKESDAR